MDNTSTLGSSPVRGIRAFEIDTRTSMLKSFNGELWQPHEVKHAVCRRAPHHEIHEPHVNCTCGVWSCKSRKHLSKIIPVWTQPLPAPTATRIRGRLVFQPSFRPRTWVSAQVDQWGVTIEHEGGYRSEYARIIPETIQWWPRPQGKDPHKRYLNHIRTKYGAWQVEGGE